MSHKKKSSYSRSSDESSSSSEQETISNFSKTPLSNFWNSEVKIYGKTFKNSESAYQSQKHPPYIDMFLNTTGYDAKIIGHHVPFDETFDDRKNKVMLEVLRAKFKEKKCRKYLLKTGDAELCEGNKWHDNYWGKCSCPKHKGKGQNQLGKILMKIRKEIKKEEEQSEESD